MYPREYNFDGIVGPTHNYGGLSPGNVASMRHEGAVSNPRGAALQGLAKMRFVRGLGVGQCVLPPHPRPSLSTLRALGYTGSDEAVLARAGRPAQHDHLVRLCSSAAAMWTANAATVAPSADTADGRVHLTPANLQAMFHRAIEAEVTTAVLRKVFSDPLRFCVHDPLPGGGQLADEGAANHLRLWSSDAPGSPGAPGAPGVPVAHAVHVFAWGRSAWSAGAVTAPTRFPARQTLEASEAVARRHGLDPSRVIHAQQDPAGIDAGAFHTDVLAVGNGPFLMLHARAFTDAPALVTALRARLGDGLRVEIATEAELPAVDAVRAYPFNSQVLTLPDGSMAILAPEDARETPTAHGFLQRVLAGDNPVAAVHYLDVRQSMHNGGGPACLRLRVVLTPGEVSALGARVLFDESLDHDLVAWVTRHYRDRLLPGDLADPALARESMAALDELTTVLGLGAVYDFQQ